MNEEEHVQFMGTVPVAFSVTCLASAQRNAEGYITTVSCGLQVGHHSLHYDKNLHIWWALFDEHLYLPVQFEEPE